jgi:hypothetical protein
MTKKYPTADTVVRAGDGRSRANPPSTPRKWHSRQESTPMVQEEVLRYRLRFPAHAAFSATRPGAMQQIREKS